VKEIILNLSFEIENKSEKGFEVRELEDDWTVVTFDNSLSSHYENTIVITDDGYELLTL
jgi:methionyl aminopeptidase